MAKEKRQSLLSEIKDLRKRADRGINPTDDEFENTFPDLWEIMTAVMIDEEKAVQPGLLTVANRLGDWAFTVSSQAYGVSKTILVQRYADGLARLNAALRDPSVPFQVYVKRSIRERKLAKEEKRDLTRNGDR